jgi:NAD(P)-dependent dehydrogenase (short-subunit alcohol dehydrogenase family)
MESLIGIYTFYDKIAIITGGASGIGRAVGAELVRHGVHVWLADINGDEAEYAAQAMDGAGTARGLTVDVTDASSVEALVGLVFEKHGRLDLMFNNAGIAVLGDTRYMSLDDWNTLIDVNLRGVIHGIAAAYPRMIEQGHGHIVNTASIAGLVPASYLTGYSLTKHGVVGLSTSLRLEAERYGVRVSVVCPGVIETPMKDHIRLLNKERNELPAGSRAEKPRGYPVDKCARRILYGVERNQGIIVVPAAATLLWILYRFAPRLARLLL